MTPNRKAALVFMAIIVCFLSYLGERWIGFPQTPNGYNEGHSADGTEPSVGELRDTITSQRAYVVDKTNEIVKQIEQITRDLQKHEKAAHSTPSPALQDPADPTVSNYGVSTSAELSSISTFSQPRTLEIWGGTNNSSMVVRITLATGNVEFGEGITPDAAAREFWNYVAHDAARSPLLLPSALRVGDCVRVLPTAERHHPGEPDQEEWDAARNLHIGQIGKLRSIMVGGDMPETMQEVPANLEWVVKFPGDEYGWGYRPNVLEVATCQK